MFSACAAGINELKKPKAGRQTEAVINVLSEDLVLSRSDALPLLNNYDAYQRLMAQWSI